jgi:hypothetical protein
MRQTLRLAIAIAVLAAVSLGCGRIWNPKTAALFDDVRLVAHLLPKNPDGSLQFSMGTYQGGTAVLGDHHTAFWVKDGVPYTVSEAARVAAPDMAQAPESIQYNDAFIAAAKTE